MCGICLVFEGLSRQCRQKLFSSLASLDNLEHSLSCQENLVERCVEQVIRRGPTVPNGYATILDRQGSEEQIQCLGNELRIHLHCSVLHLRGATQTAQPLLLPQGQQNPSVYFAWNGEVFGGWVYKQCEKTPNVSDSHVVGNLLLSAYDNYVKSVSPSLVDFEDNVLEIIEGIEGPFSTIIYFESPINQLWIARDKLGRRSFCIIDPTPTIEYGTVIISSVGPSHDGSGIKPLMKEINVSGATILKISKTSHGTSNKNILCSSSKNNSDGNALYESRKANKFENAMNRKFHIDVHFREWKRPVEFLCPKFWMSEFRLEYPISTRKEEAVTVLESLLLRAVKKRIDVPDIKSIALMFSGGLDSSILLALLLKAAPSSVQIDLLNVAFGNLLKAPDRFTALASYCEVLQLLSHKNSNNHTINLVCIDIKKNDIKDVELEVCSLLYPKDSHMDLNIGLPLYFASRGRGFLVRSNFFTDENKVWWDQYLREGLPANTVARRLTPLLLKTIDNSTSSPCNNCRLLRKPGCSHQLCRLCCERKGRESSDHQCKAHRLPTTKKITWNDELEPPHCLYLPIDSNFISAKAKGSTICPICQTPTVYYQSASPIVLVGHGADELFGGYGRHATAGRHGGNEAARIEMIKDLGRLWERNLGRDDRCIAHWGRESRHPFLDEEVVRFVGQLPFELLRSTEEDKPLLRDLARRLELWRCAEFKKRAIQFGSRSARQTNQDHFCSNRKAKGGAMYIPMSRFL